MEALRLFVTPHQRQLVIDLPEALAHVDCEVIVLPASPRPGPATAKRQPSARLQGTHINGDLTAPAVPPEDWDALA